VTAENQVEIAAAPAEVFAVVADPRTYPDWVVGCDRIRAVDPDWPRPGSRFHHTVGAGPAKIDDSTTLVRIEPPTHITLEASAGAAGTAAVTFTVEPGEQPGRTRVTIEEAAVDGPASRLPDVVTDAGLQLRNAETLRRLRRLLEGDG
jgi:uncharacterized protein YndB with AHSA1/START domain